MELTKGVCERGYNFICYFLCQEHFISGMKSLLNKVKVPRKF